uniref:Ribonuclease HII n=1 Tax=viral metagenome TaxID=1070528 RepID=A0A6C0EKM4_9ZZZZ
MKLYFDDDTHITEVGIDEAGRGCLSGRVYAAGVILPRSFPDDKYKEIKDSKKLSKKKRLELRDYIEKVALSYSVQYYEAEEIDRINILNATLNTMHLVVKNLKIKPDLILVDGNRWNMYSDEEGNVIPNQLVTKGDNLYYSIAAASILAKVYHDEYVQKLCEENPDLNKYDWLNNMCYGTQKHRDAIEKYGISKYHRKTFGICKKFS